MRGSAKSGKGELYMGLLGSWDFADRENDCNQEPSDAAIPCLGVMRSCSSRRTLNAARQHKQNQARTNANFGRA